MKRFNFKLLTALFLLTAGCSAFAQTSSAAKVNTKSGPVKLEYKYQKDDSYRILSTVEEDVYVNSRLDHKARIINRVSATVTSASNNIGLHDATFMTTEESVGVDTGKTFSWGEEYHSVFEKDAQGKYTIGDEYFMPTVRDVPFFPDKAVKPGDSWTADGHEAHDLRQTFGMKKPYLVPFTANYTYKGTVTENGKKLHLIRCTYNLYTETPERTNPQPYYNDYPVMMMGFSDEDIYFDNERGMIDHYTEKFRIIMESAYGTVYEFTGTAHAEVADLVRTSTEKNVDDVQNKIQDMGLDNVTVTRGEKGLTIALENIQFKAESAILLDSEKLKLQKIAKILELYPNNDILVVGHTALSGTEASRRILSEHRAESVANFLIKLGVKDKYHIFTQGMGSTQPVADNYNADGTPNREGMARNRRVEIIILDK